MHVSFLMELEWEMALAEGAFADTLVLAVAGGHFAVTWDMGSLDLHRLHVRQGCH